MKRRVGVIFLAILCVFLCACTKKCNCQCGCAECVCGENKSKDTAGEKDLEDYAKGKEYKGELRKDGVIIGMISEDEKTMRVSHRGGTWTLDHEEEFETHDSAWAVIADNETPGDYADDIFVAFISEN